MSVSLRTLSDSVLLVRVQDLAARERRATLSLLLHLNEIERRKLHLKEGYSSMFDYCTSGLGYSEPAAYRRIRTVRCIARFPEVYGLLEANRVNPSTIARVSRILTEANKDTLLGRIQGRSRRDVDAIAAEYEPCAKARDIVRSVVVRRSTGIEALTADTTPSVPTHAASSNDAAAAVFLAVACSDLSSIAVGASPLTRESSDACEKSAYFRREGNSHPIDRVSAVERRVQFQFTASERFREKVERVKSLAWHRLPANASLGHVFEFALDAFIAKNDPRERRHRRQACVETKTVPKGSTDDKSRHVPASTRDDVFTRDDGRCAFVGSNGRRCTSRQALQIDHVTPFARGGASTADNLRLLCAYHNRLEAERLMGPSSRRERRLRE